MYKKIIKPLIDLIFSLICSVFLIPIICVVGILIKIDDGGKVFYKAKRLGKNGKPFDMLKFRSMKENAPDLRNSDGTTYSSSSDQRLTRIGKILRETSIDELPQFLNVLFMQMSVLGPRPDPIEWYEKSLPEVRKKYTVKPGISGYSQAYFRNSLPLEEKNKNEVYYVENMSFLLDLKIFVKTIFRIFDRKDVYRDSNVTKEDELTSENVIKI